MRHSVQKHVPTNDLINQLDPFGGNAQDGVQVNPVSVVASVPLFQAIKLKRRGVNPYTPLNLDGCFYVIHISFLRLLCFILNKYRILY